MTPPESLEERWLSLFVCGSVAALAVLDISKVNVAVPALHSQLHANATQVQLIVAIYTLSFGLALIPSGRIGDIRSRRGMFMVGLVLFGVASVWCGLAPTAWMLILARLVEGLAAGMLMPQALGLIQQQFSGAERGKAFGIFGAAIGLSIALGPAIGGVLVGLGGVEWGWRLTFLFNVPIVAAIFPFALRWLPRKQVLTEGPRDLDPIGIILLSAATLALMLPFVLTTGVDDPPQRWGLLALAAALGGTFSLWEKRYRASGRAPAVDVALFLLPGYRNGVALAMLYFCGVPGVLLATTLFLQDGLHVDVVLAGFAILPFAIGFTFTAWMSGSLTHRHGRRLVVAGLAIVAIGLAGAALSAVVATDQLAAWTVPLFLGIAGVGGGAVTAPNQALTLDDVARDQGGLAGAVAQAGQRIGSAIGVAVIASVFYATIASAGATADHGRAFRMGYGTSTGIAFLFVLAALLVGILDLRWRGRRRSSTPSTDR